MSSTSHTQRLRRCRNCDHRSPCFEPKCPSCGARLRPPMILFVMAIGVIVLAAHFVYQI
jgi:NAD-dependent SIR2 family protein deacetylase